MGEAVGGMRHIVIHHSLTDDGENVSWGAIRKYHIEGNGWSDIGYHAGIELIGKDYEVFFGRMPDEVGAHCRELNMNKSGIGICCVGNFDLIKPPIEMVNKLLSLCKYFMRTYHIPWQNVLGHREAQAMGGVPSNKRKTCPGTKFDMEAIRRYLGHVS